VAAAPCRRPLRAVAAMLLPLVLSLAAAVIQPGAAAQETEAVAAEEAPLPEAVYTMQLTGALPDELRDLLQKSSLLETLRAEPPPSFGALVRRTDNDVERFNQVLRSEGYYAGTIRSSIDENATPIAVTIDVDPGPVFRLKYYAIVDEGGEPLPALPALSELGLQIGQPARAADIVIAGRKLLRNLADRGQPLAKIADQEAVVDHAELSMAVTVHLDPGPEVTFGATAITGFGSVDENHVRRLIPWAEGDPYDQRRVDRFRRKLVRTGLFGAVIIDHADAADAGGRLPMTVELVEGKHRSVGLGAKYYTSEGPAIEGFWEHRNLLGAHESLRIALLFGAIRQELTNTLTLHDFKRPDQDLRNEIKLSRQRINGFGGFVNEGAAYDSDGVSALSALRRPLTDQLSGELGVSLAYARLREPGSDFQPSTLLGLPGALDFDSSDDPLDPAEGIRVRVAPTPYVGWFEQTTQFLSNELSASGYLSLDKQRRYVLAARSAVGAIFGPSRDRIPTDKRFYAGGGDSIRGYPFQSVGPLDDDDNPLGGRSLLLLSAELRARVWGNFGIVPFIDAGNVYTAVVPDFDEALRVGAGLGFRYRTPIGPLRLDFAVPLNRRKSVDDPFQFYINIGQAF
jgi:translocation and assembly module TamA